MVWFHFFFVFFSPGHRNSKSCILLQQLAVRKTHIFKTNSPMLMNNQHWHGMLIYTDMQIIFGSPLKVVTPTVFDSISFWRVVPECTEPHCAKTFIAIKTLKAFISIIYIYLYLLYLCLFFLQLTAMYFSKHNQLNLLNKPNLTLKEE